MQCSTRRQRRRKLVQARDRTRKFGPCPQNHFRGRKLRAAAEKCSAASPELAKRFIDILRGIQDAKMMLDSPAALDLEDLERRLTVLEDKLSATLSSAADAETMVAVRREMDRALAPYRRKMSAEQLTIVERQYIQKRLFENYRVSRLSLYYLK